MSFNNILLMFDWDYIPFIQDGTSKLGASIHLFNKIYCDITIGRTLLRLVLGILIVVIVFLAIVNSIFSYIIVQIICHLYMFVFS